MIYRNIGLTVFFSLFFVACNNEEGKADTSISVINRDTAKVSTQNSASLRVKIFNNDTAKSGNHLSGFGYDIYMNDVLYIHQPSVPAVPGNNGFSSEANAEKAAKLVVYKIEHNIMPPSVTPQELDSLGVWGKTD